MDFLNAAAALCAIVGALFQAVRWLGRWWQKRNQPAYQRSCVIFTSAPVAPVKPLLGTWR